MTRLFCILLLNLLHNVIFAQTLKVLEYSSVHQPKSVAEAEEFKQSLSKNLGSSESSKDFIKSLFAKNHLHTTYFNQDSSISIHYMDGVISHHAAFKFGKSGGLINLHNGEFNYIDSRLIQKTVDKTLGKGLITIEQGNSKDEIVKRLNRKEIVNGYECESWELLLPQYKSEIKYWVWKEKTDFESPNPSMHFFQGKLVIRSVEHNTQSWDQTITRSLVRIDSLQHYSVQDKINELLALHAGEMMRYYADLPNNQIDDSTHIEVGSILPAFNVRTIETDHVTHLDSLLKDSKFLLIDIWASWCGPCIKSLPELQKLKNDYGTNLQILSLNYGDESFSKIQNVLDKAEPSWPQAFSSHRIYRLINKEHAYPTMLIIDRNRKIVLQGQPDLSITAIRNFLDEQLK